METRRATLRPGARLPDGTEPLNDFLERRRLWLAEVTTHLRRNTERMGLEVAPNIGLTLLMEKIGARLTAFNEPRLKPGEDISVLLHDDARRKELSRRAWSGEEP